MISNGSIIDVDDLNAVFSSQLTSLQTENATLPVCYRLVVNFNNIVSGTASAWLSKNITIPDDAIIHEVAIIGGEHNGTVTVTLNNGAMISPLVMTGALGANYQKLTRYYSAATNPLQMLLKGSVLGVTVSTTNAVATSNLQISILLLSPRRVF